MANFVGDAFAYLIAWQSTFYKDYAPGIYEQIVRFGSTTRHIPKSKRRMKNMQIEYEVEAGVNRGTRASYDLMAAIPDHRPGRFVNFTVNCDHTNSANNDIINFELGFQTTIWDLMKRSNSNFKDGANYVERDVRQGIDDVKETVAKFLHLPSDGAIGTISTSGVVADDSDVFAVCSAYSNGDTAARIKVDSTSIARIGVSQLVEIRSSAGALIADALEVTSVHPYDQTFVVRLTDDSVNEAGAAVANLDSVAATNKVYLHGAYNIAVQGSLAQFFDVSTNYFARDRTDPVYNCLQPIRIDVGGDTTTIYNTTVDLTEDHIAKAGEAAGWSVGDGNAKNPLTMVMARDQYRAMKKLAKDQALHLAKATGAESKMFHFGHDGFVLHDPAFGTVALTIDDFAEYGLIRFLNMNDWEVVSPFEQGFEMMPGGNIGIWTRNSESDGSGNPSKTFSAQGMMPLAWVCTRPQKQIEMGGLTTTL